MLSVSHRREMKNDGRTHADKVQDDTPPLVRAVRGVVEETRKVEHPEGDDMESQGMGEINVRGARTLELGDQAEEVAPDRRGEEEREGVELVQEAIELMRKGEWAVKWVGNSCYARN